MIWSRVPRLAKESVAAKKGSSAGWMPERVDKWSVGKEGRHLLAMRKTSFRTLSIRRVCALRHQTGASTGT